MKHLWDFMDHIIFRGRLRIDEVFQHGTPKVPEVESCKWLDLLF